MIWGGRLLSLECPLTDYRGVLIPGVSWFHCIHIGYTMKPRGLRYLEPRGNCIDARARSARASIGFQGDLNTVGPEGFIV